MLRDIYRKVNERNSPYYDIYYLTDTEVRFSINDDKINRVLIYSIRFENNKYNAYGFEKSKIANISNIMRHKIKEVKTVEEFWKWYEDFYNNSY